MFVAERGMAHDALDSSESRLRAIFSTASYGIITVDDRDVIVAANPAASVVFDLAQDTLAGMHVCELLPDFERASRLEEASELDGIRGDGSSVPIELAVRSSATSGSPPLRIAIVRDITRRRELEKKVSATQAELNRSARLAAAGEMAAALAHELHQPLSAIVNYASASQLVARSAAPALMRKVESEAVRAAEIVQRLRNFFQAGTMRLERVDVRDLIEISLAHARQEAASKHVDLEMTVAHEAELLVDRVQIETVLHCLIGNAIDSIDTLQEGKRQIRVEAASSREGWIDLSVIDSGRGISPVMLGRLFEPFATNKASGIGLGLSVSRSLIEAHGGKLWAESRPAGAAFHFSLPTPELEQAGSHGE
jgi:two-component system sensor kinase FixL